MVDQPAQKELDKKYPNQTFKNGVNKINIGDILADPTNDKLTGKLVIKDFPDLDGINLSRQKLTDVEIINCPKLIDINFFQNQLNKLDFDKANVDATDNTIDADELKKINCAENKLTKLSFKYCSNLADLKCGENDNLTWIDGLEDLENLESLSVGKVKIRSVYAEKLNYYKDLVKSFKEMLGLDPKEPLPYSLKTGGKFDPNKLKEQTKDKIGAMVQADYPQLKAKLEAQKDYDDIKTERDQLKQQLAAIRNELGLAEDSPNQQAIDEIKKLKNRPTSSCSHTDYDAVKSERDTLRNEVESKNRRISELENENKENVGGITREDLAESAKTNLEKLGIKVLDDSKLQNATTAQNVEKIRNEMISDEFNKLKDEKNSAYYLNLGLGAITLGSLIFIAWMAMRQNYLPKEEEPEKKKE
jgi:hypothetical protein